MGYNEGAGTAFGNGDRRHKRGRVSLPPRKAEDDPDGRTTQRSGSPGTHPPPATAGMKRQLKK